MIKKNKKWYVLSIMFLLCLVLIPYTLSKYSTTIRTKVTINARQPEYDVVFNQLLPDEYQEVEYIESTGTQYIDTGILVDSNTLTDGIVTESKIAYTTNSGQANYKNQTPYYFIGVYSDNTFYSGLGPTYTRGSSFQNDNKEHVFRLDSLNKTFSIDNQVVTQYNISRYTGTYIDNIHLFNVSTTNTYYTREKLYYTKIWSNGELVRNLIPCYRKNDNVIGLYDMVSKTFFTNARTGTFSKGEDITNGYHEAKTQHFVYGTAQNLTTNTYTREGYTSNGWNTEPDGSGTSYTDEQEVNNLTNVDGDIINLYAQWKSIKYTITYNYNGGVDESRILGKWDMSNSSNTATSIIDISGKNKNGTITNATLYNDYLQFNGTSSVVRFGTMNSSYMTIEATFSVDEITGESQYIIANIHTGGLGIYVSSSGKIGAMAYIGGSYRTLNSGILVELGKRYHAVLTYDGVTEKLFVNGDLTASFDISGTIRNPLSSTIMALGCNPRGTNSTDGSYFNGKIYNAAVYTNTKASKTVTYDTTYGDLPTPTREGYIFDGWYAGETKVGSAEIVKITEDTRLVAKWIPNTYTIKYIADEDAEGTMSDSVVAFDEEIKLPKHTYTQDDYTFFEWNTKADKTGLHYADEESVINLSKENNGVVNLYTTFGYNITYNLDGGKSDTENPRYYNKQTGTFTLNNPSKTGYDFIGWTGSNGETPETTVTIPDGTTGDLEFTANFSAHKLYIQLDANGGTMASQHGSAFAINADGLITKNGSTIIHTVSYGG